MLSIPIQAAGAAETASETRVLHVYGPGGPLSAMKAAAAAFGASHGVTVQVTAGPLYAAVILFSAAALVFGAMLMAGLFTRVAALVTMGFSVLLMAMFGWQGATCINEWTMAACNLAMGTTLLLGGSGAYSLDNVLLRRKPALANNAWFRRAGGSLPLPQGDRGSATWHWRCSPSSRSTTSEPTATIVARW